MPSTPGVSTSLEKALELCEALAGAQRGLSVTELARSLKQPAPTVHRLLAVLKRRGYVRQDEDTARYRLTLKMLDLSFRLLGRSELRLHAYPVLREIALGAGLRTFVTMPPAGEVTYVWKAGPDEVSMHTAFGREMPGHCACYFDHAGSRRLSCIKLAGATDATQPDRVLVRLGRPEPPSDPQRLLCTCAPVHDYTGREVARVGVFGHGASEPEFCDTEPAAAADMARRISLRLGYLQ
ncbi:MAG TPA: helix-turn-helix domain-containing protein [Gemmatimonadaceae bacterium]|nr:helix-turn-helix domain-containing protein [Vicinamibacterales bacterium]